MQHGHLELGAHEQRTRVRAGVSGGDTLAAGGAPGLAACAAAGERGRAAQREQGAAHLLMTTSCLASCLRINSLVTAMRSEIKRARCGSIARRYMTTKV